jgi:sec-independent protein translocase protein TatA
MGISVSSLLIILAIVLLLFGTKRLKTIGGDLGSSIKNFKLQLKDSDTDVVEKTSSDQQGKAP